MKKLAILWALIMIASCGMDSRAGGTSSHENVIQARIIDENANPVVGAKIWLRHADSKTPLTATSDSLGFIEFQGLSSGEYYLESRYLGTGAFTKIQTSVDSNWIIPLKPLGVFQHCFDMGFSGDTLRVIGMDLHATLDSVGCIFIDSLPVAEYSIQINDLIQEHTAQHGLHISIPNSIPVASPYWIPIRLGEGDLDYSQNAFSIHSHEGYPLQFELEEWDDSPGSAIIWIRLDSLPATNTSIYLLRQAETIDPSNTIDTNTNEWMQLLHFLRDDTNGYINHGSVNGAGMIGSARLFTMRTQSLSLLMDGSILKQGTLSFWVRLDSLNSMNNTLILQSQSISIQVNRIASTTELEVLFIDSLLDTLSLKSQVAVGNEAWHLISLQWMEKGSATLFVDGSNEDSTILIHPMLENRDSLTFGAFLGAIDELRIGPYIPNIFAIHQNDFVYQQRNSQEVFWSSF